MVNPALISAGASLLGGLLGKPKNVSALRNRYDDVAGIFKAAEEFKFSPFALLGSPAVGPSVVQNTMGSAIADAGLLLADGMSKQKMKALEEERLRLENEKLRGEVNRMILRPKVGVPKTTIGANSDPRKTDTSETLTDGTEPAGLEKPNGKSHGDPWAAATSGLSQNAQEPLIVEYTSHGETTQAPRGPDIDELGTGLIMNAKNRAKAVQRRRAAGNADQWYEDVGWRRLVNPFMGLALPPAPPVSVIQQHKARNRKIVEKKRRQREAIKNWEAWPY